MGFLYKIVCTLLILWIFVALAQAEERPCSPEAIGEATLSRGHIKIVHGVEQARQDFETIYDDPRRLRGRFYKNDSGQILHRWRDTEVVIPGEFVSRLTERIENALALQYADHLYYADLGHAHLLLPQTVAPQALEREGDQLLRSALASLDLGFLFHTAELYKLRAGTAMNGELTSDPWLQWRYHSRNFFADARNPLLTVLFQPPPQYNTVRAIEGYRAVTEVYFSANKNGCFTYRQNGRTYYFDISLN